MARGFSWLLSYTWSKIGATSQATRTRANLIGDPFLENPTPQRWFYTAAFTTPQPCTFGTAGRNILRSDSLENLDVSLFREDRIAERVRLQSGRKRST
jgi:hypothetical protein